MPSHDQPTLHAAQSPAAEPPAPGRGEPPIEAAPFEAPHFDVLGGAARRTIRVLDHGFVSLVDAMPRLVPEGRTADFAVVQAARVSYGMGTRQVSEDRGLIRYLMRHRHTTPFEMVEFKFHVAMPIFVARQWIRHRTASVNEYSARYSILPDRFYHPTIENIRKQSKANRQGGEERFNTLEVPSEVRTAEEFLGYLKDSEALYERYLKLTEQGVSRELARIALPVSVYTEWYWKCDLHNTLRFLALRLDPHAQAEIREFAAAMLRLLEPVVPLSIEAWRDYELDSTHLSRLEIEAIRDAAKGGPGILKSENKRELAEWESKRALLGL